jgi:hypothetical protein
VQAIDDAMVRDDAMAGRLPTGILGKCLCVVWARTDVGVGTVSARVEAMVVSDRRFDRRVCSSFSDRQPSCAESVARSAAATVVVDNQIPERDE